MWVIAIALTVLLVAGGAWLTFYQAKAHSLKLAKLYSDVCHARARVAFSRGRYEDVCDRDREALRDARDAVTEMTEARDACQAVLFARAAKEDSFRADLADLVRESHFQYQSEEEQSDAAVS